MGPGAHPTIDHWDDWRQGGPPPAPFRTDFEAGLAFRQEYETYQAAKRASGELQVTEPEMARALDRLDPTDYRGPFQQFKPRRSKAHDLRRYRDD